jgi:phospholipase D-like protein
MRTPIESDGPLRVRAIAGTRVVLMAMDIAEEARNGLRGFAIKRKRKGSTGDAEWLPGIKYFKDLVNSVTPNQRFSSREQPFQSFLWSDYESTPNTAYELTIVALYGPLDALEERYSVMLTVKTEAEQDKNHGIWFNRGAIASRARAERFLNERMDEDKANNVTDEGKMLDPQAEWLSRGLVEACLRYINDTQKDQGLRVCAYEFTYPPVLLALKRALKRGVDVRIIYHADDERNVKAVEDAQLPAKKGNRQILFERTRTAIPHNKFIIRLQGKDPVSVFTGSTNFTDSGFMGQTNVGHLVLDTDLAATYLELWESLKDDPTQKVARMQAIDLTPNPPNVVPKNSVTAFFSPRIADNMLDWYALRLANAGSLSLTTLAFNVADTILEGLSSKQDSMRLVILENEPTPEANKAERANRGKLVFSNGAILGKTFIKYKKQGGAKMTPITETPLEEWFVDEELARPINSGRVFFIHSKVMVIDPLSDDPWCAPARPTSPRTRW